MGVTKAGKGRLVETVGGCGDCFISCGFKVWKVFFFNSLIKISVFLPGVLYMSTGTSVDIHPRVFKVQSLNVLEQFALR